MNQRYLGLVGILCSPFLFLDFLMNGLSQSNSSTIELFDMIYMTGWMAGILGLFQMKAAGTKSAGRLVLIIQMCLLLVAQISTFLAIFTVRTSSAWAGVSDIFWPLSNLFMLVTGIAIIKAKSITGFKRFIPFLMGLWLPITGVAMNILNPDVVLIAFSGPYSAIAWGLLGLVIFSAKHPNRIPVLQKVRHYKFNILSLLLHK